MEGRKAWREKDGPNAQQFPAVLAHVLHKDHSRISIIGVLVNYTA